jgi:GntR family transcriptional regulator
MVMVLKPATASVTDLTSAEHRFRQVAKIIAGQIAAGEIQRGTRLMSERDLGKHFNVSRVTIRRALLELQDRGLIEPEGARGWFVTSSLGEPNALMGFSEMARARGLTPSSHVLSATTRSATIDEAERLGIAPGASLFDLERIRLLDAVPVAHERSRIVLDLAPDVASREYAALSLYDELRRAGIVAYSADYVLQATAATPNEAELLDVVVGAPLLVASATTHMQSGKAIELSHSVFRGDRYRFRTTLFRSAWK